MTMQEVKSAMLTGATVVWQGRTYIICACSIKLSRNNPRAPTEPFYYTLTLQDIRTPFSVCEVLIGEVEKEETT